MSEVEEKQPEFARVGSRLHLVTGGPLYAGQPEVALCNTVLIRNPSLGEDLPLCLDCHIRNVDRLRFMADEMLDEANELALKLSTYYKKAL